MSTTTDTTTYRIRVSTGAEIQEQGKYAATVAIEYADGTIDGAAWSSAPVAIPEGDEHAAETVYLDEALREAKTWAEDHAGVVPEWTDAERSDRDEFGGWTVLVGRVVS